MPRTSRPQKDQPDPDPSGSQTTEDPTDGTATSAQPTTEAATSNRATADDEDTRADLWERRLAIPVIVAAAISVPAVFLTTLEPPSARLAGHALNWISVAVFGAETVVLVLMSRHRLRWIARHKWKIGITAVALPAVVFALAPVQALRLLQLIRLVGTLRVLRARTIIKAGRIVARRLDLPGHWRHLLVLGATLVAAGFVALVLRDPTAARQHRAAVEQVTGWTGTVPVIIAGIILAVATFIVIRFRRRD